LIGTADRYVLGIKTARGRDIVFGIGNGQATGRNYFIQSALDSDDLQA
jgi:hypothetical protein